MREKIFESQDSTKVDPPRPRRFSGILIQYRGAPKIINVTLKDIESVLGCPEGSPSRGSSIGYLEYFGYNATMFWVEKDELINVNPKNPLASLIIKERGPILGNAIILDDGKDLIVDDIRKIVEIAKVVPSIRWVAKPILDRLLEDPSDSDLINGIIKSMEEVSGTREQRDAIWNKIGKYYIPRKEDFEDEV